MASLTTGTSWWLLAFTSLVEFATVADLRLTGDKFWAWGLAAGVISFVACLIILCGMFFDVFNDLMSLEPYIAVFLVALWAAACGTNTSQRGPGSTFGNVYFFSWISLFLSMTLMFRTLVESCGLDVVDKLQGKKSTAGGEGSD